MVHDLNDRLAAILSSAYLARLGLPDGRAVEKEIGQIEEAAQRAASLVKKLSSLVRGSSA